MAYAEHWISNHPAIWEERAPHGDRAIMLRHPTYPYEGPTDGTIENDHSRALTRFAAAYLQRVRARLGLPPLFEGDPLETGSSAFITATALTWLPVHEDETPARPDRSFWVRRYRDPEAPARLVDRSVVLLAVQSEKANDHTRALHSRLGIRIVAHIAPAPGGRWKARITGVVSSIALVGAPQPNVEPTRGYLQIFFDPAPNDARERLEERIRSAAGLATETALFIDGMRIVASSRQRIVMDMYSNVPPTGSPPHTLPLRIVSRLLIDPSASLDEAEIQIVEKFPLVAHADPVKARVFPQDPASRAGLPNVVDARPNRSPRRLKKYWKRREMPGLTFGPFGETLLSHGDTDVMRSKWVDTSANEADREVVCPCCVRQPRLNWAAAFNGYWHAHSLFDTMLAYGVPPAQYFKLAALPLRIRYRAGIDPGAGKDGKTVNARVTYDPPHCDMVAFVQGAVKPLQVKFALADVKRSVSRREPLGLAADPRWSWHEYGHVLLAASTGATQLHFVHSTGDALAAILADPRSRLATHERMRGFTFPWVYLNRRHDRDVFLGWSWSGRYHRASRFPTVFDPSRRKGYDSEQILSTSLFRLYRALGGDTALRRVMPPHYRRRSASDYTAYLIMKAIGLLGSSSTAPIETPDQLVSALIDADTGTLPLGNGPLAWRVGGCAHKVVRWAFEAQGLYTGAATDAVVNEPGKPLDPDVFIDDRRPDSPGDAPRGGYMPVPLNWRRVPPPLWHARRRAIRVRGHRVRVEVSNRGPSNVNQVWVEVWYRRWRRGRRPPRWNRNRWTLLGTDGPRAVGPWPAVTRFRVNGLPTAPRGRRLLIMAVARCDGDPSNIDQSTGLPCSSVPTPIVDLVAGDNNLGLRRYIIR